jgi:hypothetical protein
MYEVVEKSVFIWEPLCRDSFPSMFSSHTCIQPVAAINFTPKHPIDRSPSPSTYKQLYIHEYLHAVGWWKKQQLQKDTTMLFELFEWTQLLFLFFPILSLYTSSVGLFSWALFYIFLTVVSIRLIIQSQQLYQLEEENTLIQFTRDFLVLISLVTFYISLCCYLFTDVPPPIFLLVVAICFFPYSRHGWPLFPHFFFLIVGAAFSYRELRIALWIWLFSVGKPSIVSVVIFFPNYFYFIIVKLYFLVYYFLICYF